MRAACLDDGVRAGPPALNGLIHEAQPEAHIEHVTAGARHHVRVRFHQWRLPPSDPPTDLTRSTVPPTKLGYHTQGQSTKSEEFLA